LAYSIRVRRAQIGPTNHCRSWAPKQRNEWKAN
jgi:hypothetical protein